MSDKIFYGQPRAAREVEATAFAGRFAVLRSDADATIAAATGDVTFWHYEGAPREATMTFLDEGTPNRLLATTNMHVVGACNVNVTWVTPPTAGDTVKFMISSNYAVPDAWIAQVEVPVGNNPAMSVSLAIADFIPEDEYWELLITNNTDQELTFNAKLMVYRVG